MNDAFEKLLNQTIGMKTPKTLEDKLAAAEAERKAATAKVEQIQKEIEERKKTDAEMNQEREIVIRYIPNKACSARVVKGAEPIEPDKPDNVVAMLDAAAAIMSSIEGVNRHVLSMALLTTLMRTLEVEVALKGVVH